MTSNTLPLINKVVEQNDAKYHHHHHHQSSCICISTLVFVLITCITILYCWIFFLPRWPIITVKEASIDDYTLTDHNHLNAALNFASRSPSTSSNNSEVGNPEMNDLPHEVYVPKYQTPDTYLAGADDDVRDHVRFVIAKINEYNQLMRSFDVENPYERDAVKCYCLAKSLPMREPWIEFRRAYFLSEVRPFNPNNMNARDYCDDVEFIDVRIEDLKGVTTVNEMLIRIFDWCHKEEGNDVMNASARIIDKASNLTSNFISKSNGSRRSKSNSTVSMSSTLSSVVDRVDLDPNYEPDSTPESSYDSGYARESFRLN